MNYFIQNIPKSHFVHQGFARAIKARTIKPSPVWLPFILIPYYCIFTLPYYYFKMEKRSNLLCEGFAGLYFACILKLVRKDIFVVYHDADALFHMTYPHLRGIKKRYFDFFLRCIDKVISDSMISKNLIQDSLSLSYEIPVVYPFIDTKRYDFNTKKEAMDILYIGRLSPEKNLLNLLRAFQLVRSEFKHTNLWIVGDGPQKAQLKNEVQKLGLKNVHFEGWRTDFSRYTRRSVIGYNVSVFEPFGCSGLEYVLSGVVPLLGKRNGNAEVLKTDVLITNQDDYGAIANSMIGIIRMSDENRSSLLNDLRETTLTYNEKNQCDKFKESFERITK